MPTTTTTAPTTTTTAPPAFTDPLTGMPRFDEPASRAAIAVKFDNHPNARPHQVGLPSADLVFDLRAEGVTRFMAVFHSEVPGEVGPVRSSRTSDFDLLRGLDSPLYASSGGNAYVMGEVGALPVFPVTNQTRREYYRGEGASAPHNLYVDPEVLYGVVGDAAVEVGAPQPWFDYRPTDAVLPTGARPVDAIEIDFTNSPTVDFAWDAELGVWLRSQDGVAHIDAATGVQIGPENVVIMITTYGTSAADASSPEVRSTGSGELIVLSEGHRIDGTWERTSAEAKPVLLSSTGEPIALTPGQTWVLYPESGQVTEPTG
ncbi:MAG: DUF3048 domain-containing protein [Actinomycetota bacterium]